MTRDDLNALIARVEAATGPDREADTAAFLTAHRPAVWFGSAVTAISVDRDGKWRCVTADKCMHLDCGEVPHYTASLDAAASLYPTLPETIPSCPRKATAAALRARLAQIGDDA